MSNILISLKIADFLSYFDSLATFTKFKYKLSVKIASKIKKNVPTNAARLNSLLKTTFEVDDWNKISDRKVFHKQRQRGKNNTS